MNVIPIVLTEDIILFINQDIDNMTITLTYYKGKHMFNSAIYCLDNKVKEFSVD